MALPLSGIAQHGHPSVETRQDVGLLAWALGSGGTIQFWTLNNKGMSLPGEVYLKYSRNNNSLLLNITSSRPDLLLDC